MSEGVDQLKVEIDWCLARLEEKLSGIDPFSKPAQEAAKVHRILRSSKAPVAKKRQAMRNMFGDYREKMKAMEKKNLQAMKKSKLMPVKDPPTESKFLRFSSGAAQIHKAVTAAASAVDQLSVKESTQSTSLSHPASGFPEKVATLCSGSSIFTTSSAAEDKEFKFEFDCREGDLKGQSAPAAASDGVSVPVAVNYFVLKPSVEEFQFDFGSESRDLDQMT